jgi:elongation factor 1-beta
MGSVAIIVKVMPESPEIDIEKLKVALHDALKPELTGITHIKIGEIQKEPIGFGLNALKVPVIINDASGEPERVEEALSKVPGVESAQITELTLT